MQLNTADAEFLIVTNFGDLVVGDLRSVDDGNASLPVNFHHAFAVQDDRRVFVNPNTEVVRIKRDRSDEAAYPAPLGEVLVYDDVFEEAQSRRKPHTVLVRMRRRFASDDHRGAHTRGTGARSGQYNFCIADQMTQL